MERSGRAEAPETAAADVDPAVDLEGVDLPAMLGSAATPSARERAVSRAVSRTARDSLREIWALSWPLMLSQVLLNVVGLVDIAMVGRLGSESVAAVGYATQFSQLSQSVLYAVGFATVALMAHAIGAGDPLRARHSLAAALIVSIGTAAVITFALLAAPGAMLAALGADPAVARAAIPYLQLVVSSSLLLAVGMTLEFALRADRDTRTPMLIAAVVTAVKIAGNSVLIFGAGPFPRLELVGAGLATLLSQGIGLLLFATVVVRASGDSPLAVRPRDFAAARPLVPEVIRLMVPGVGERLANNLAMLAYFRVLSGYGSVVIAAYTVGVRLLAFSWIPGIAFGTAASTLVGQALGAGRREAAVSAGWRATHLSLVVAVVLGGAWAAMPRLLAGLFTHDAALIDELVPFMITLALAQPALQSHFALGGAHRGAGDTFTPFVAAAIGNWALRVPLAFLFAGAFDAPVLWIWLVILGDHIARAIWLALSFRRERWATSV
ncbi:MAG: MATE family efflux transporter [Deltaproteobacteria bacterium]|nr:MAG: MATE family efflux transporter [Deltaproteobacteria bacterium]